jgi:hypothetical protein
VPFTSRPSVKSLLATVVLGAVVALCWLGSLDRFAQDQTEQALETTLISFALARTLNGVISVAQGTEIAVQPAGVGVVLTAGEILDPLNDLVERFSWIVLVAASSLALQLLVGELVTTPWMNIVTTAAAVGCIVSWWLPDGRWPGVRTFVMRLTLFLVAVRFMLVATAFAMSALGAAYLDEREEDAVAFLSDTSADVERADATERRPRTDSDSLLEQLDDFIAAQRETLNIDRRLSRLQRQIEAGINEVLDLIVVYVLKTIIVPIAVLLAIWAWVRSSWRAVGARSKSAL